MESSALVDRPKSDTFAIADLVSLARQGKLRVPRFQRSFVWDNDDVRKLFDSIWRGFPIGTLLLWKRDADADRVAFGPLEIDVPGARDAYAVVDGQQRVSSLVGALASEVDSPPQIFEVCFDLRTQRFVHAGRRPRPAWWLPLRVTLQSSTTSAWTREHQDELTEEDFGRVDALVGALRDYKVPAYVVEDDDEELLREIFDRVNAAGKPISRAQVFHALYGGRTPTASAAAVAEGLCHLGFGQLDEQRIVQSLLAIRGGDVQRDLHDEFAPNEDRQRWFDDTERALSRTIDYLRRQGVPHLLLVPTSYPLPVLAAFFHLHPQPDPWNERLLTRWLWRTWAHGYGRAGQTPALRQAVRAVNPRKGVPSLAPGEFAAVRSLLDLVPDQPAGDLYPSSFQTNSATGRLGLLALAAFEPRRLNGEPVDIAVELERLGTAAITELGVGHRTELAARGFWPAEQPPPTGREEMDILSSHGIDPIAAHALRSHHVDGFLAERSGTLRERLDRFLAARLDVEAPVRPPLSDLYVPDPVASTEEIA